MLREAVKKDDRQEREQLQYKCDACRRLTFINKQGLPIPARVYCAWCGCKEAVLEKEIDNFDW